MIEAPCLRGDATSWWDPRWTWRRAVVVDPPQTDLPGADAAWVECFTHGEAAPSGADIRVLSSAGQPVKSFAMQSGPDDRTRVCFALTGRGNRYFVYYGNAKAAPLSDEWRPERGVLLEGWAYRGGAISTLALTRETFEKAGAVVGRTFVPNVFIGHNPFGPPADYCHLYTGWLICGTAGSYLFCTTSKDASFLLVDDQVVVQWPGRHGPVAEARYTGRTDLTRGLHKLSYYHVSIGVDGRAVAAWQPPGAPAPAVIPPTAFAPMAKATPSDLDRHATQFQADFTIEGPFEAFFQNRYTYRYAFQARSGERLTSEARCEWDFGDGQTADRMKVDHVYLAPGLRTVSLKIRQAGRQSTIRNRIQVTRDWNRVMDPRLDAVEDHAKIVADYRPGDVAPADLITAVWLLKRAGQTRSCLAALAAIPQRVNELKPEVMIEAIPDLYSLVVTDAGQPQTALRWFEAVEAKAADMTLKATAGAMAGRVALEELADLRHAEAAFDRVVRQYADRTRAPAVRRARIGLGDVFLRTGRYRQAQQACEQAGLTTEGQRLSIRVGSYARAVDDFLRRKEFGDAAEQLDRWEWEYPLEKLRGYSTLMRAELFSRQKRYADLVRLVEQFPLVVVEGNRPTDPVEVIYATVDPARLPELYRIDPATGRILSSVGTAFPPNSYGMQMGLLAVEAHVQLKQRDRARSVLDVLIRLYPDSPLLSQARDRLKNLGGSVGSAPSHGGRP
jgi:tetratricopeptide (TPR) repeat protein